MVLITTAGINKADMFMSDSRVKAVRRAEQPVGWPDNHILQKTYKLNWDGYFFFLFVSLLLMLSLFVANVIVVTIVLILYIPFYWHADLLRKRSCKIYHNS